MDSDRGKALLGEIAAARKAYVDIRNQVFAQLKAGEADIVSKSKTAVTLSLGEAGARAAGGSRGAALVLVRAALERLTPSLRAAIVLRDLQELSYQDIATQLHLPEGTVKSRINRGRAELARQIARIRDSQDHILKPGAKA